MEHENSGAFHGCYEIGTPRPGAVLFHVDLVMDGIHQMVQGAGRITQAINPPLNITVILNGQYEKCIGISDKTYICISAAGYKYNPSLAGQYASIPIVKLQITLEVDLRSGVASYSYFLGDSRREIEGAPVKLIPCNQI